ncbi:ER-to-golgi vesicle protein transport Sft2, partial [Mycena pura]
MASKGWFNLETAGVGIPETQFFEGDSAFKFLGLSRTTRLYGFVGCLALGFLLSILGSITLFLGQITLFAFLYGLGTLISLAGTGFLIGFLTQLKLMFKPIRVVATIIFLASIGMVFVGAFVLSNDFVVSPRYHRISGIHVVQLVVHPLRTVCGEENGWLWL